MKKFLYTKIFSLNGHTFFPSSSVVPNNDPTLQFTNSGMVQFKSIFLGKVDPNSELATLRRAVNSQKCIRAGGKHNDLDDVGKDTYHHTFFEMLGNWSFSDYFKREAIDMAFTLLTNVYGLLPSQLYATYFGGDEDEGLEPDLESREIWLGYLPEDHIVVGSKKDNFWEMGNTGPCGPCSEIHYDRLGRRNVANLVNCDDPTVIEIWNLVFMQFNREPSGLSRLSNRHIDTGMGFERLVSILQGKMSNYDTDIFEPIFSEIQAVTKAKPYEGKVGPEDVGRKDTAYRVVADHIRTLVVAIGDGCYPGAVDRGYILRRILRRAVRYGKEVLNAKQGFLSAMVPVIVKQMSDFYEELSANESKIVETIALEELKFERSLVLGLKKFHSIVGGMDIGATVGAEQVFVLYDSYGFPEDLTRLMAEERGLKVDERGFEALLEQRKNANRDQQSRRLAGETTRLDLGPRGVSELKDGGIAVTDDIYKYEPESFGRAVAVVALWDGSTFLNSWDDPERRVAIILDRTSFYCESGGQVADRGTIRLVGRGMTRFIVEDVQGFGGYVCHVGRLQDNHGVSINVGDEVELQVDIGYRQQVASNHTATHLVNLALREVLGEGLDQRGSLVAQEKLRFDFNRDQPIRADAIKILDDQVNQYILDAHEVYYGEVPLKVAKSIYGIRAMFDEKYSDPVRVVSIGIPMDCVLKDPFNAQWGSYSIELCGGTHLRNTSDLRQFVIVEEGQHAQGIHRLTAFTGDHAYKAQLKADSLSTQLAILKTKEDQVDFSSLLNKFIFKFERSVIPVYSRMMLREQILQLKSKIQKTAIRTMKEMQVTIAAHVQDILERIAQNNPKVWIEEIPLCLSQEQLTKMTKNIIDHTHRSISVMLFSRNDVNDARTDANDARTDVNGARTLVSCVVVPQHVDMGLHARSWVESAINPLQGKFGGNATVAQGQALHAHSIQLALSAATSHSSSIIKQ